MRRIIAWCRAALLGVAILACVQAETRTWTNRKGDQIVAEMAGLAGDQVVLRRGDGEPFKYPLAALTDSDQAYVKAWQAGTAGAGRVARAGGAEGKQGLALAESALGKQVSAKLVKLNAGNTGFVPAPLESGAAPRYYAIYYSAKWCPPCRGFTPELVQGYQELKAQGADFELIFVSADESEKEMLAYMKEYKMPWPGLRYNAIKGSREITRYAGEGIPCLVFLDHQGKVLSDSYRNGEYVGPGKVLNDMRRTLGSGPGRKG